MAVQMALNVEGDIYLDENGDLALVRDGPEIAQHLRQRLNFFQGEWFLDTSAGVPWFQEILGARRFATQQVNQPYAESILRAEVLGTPGVTRLIKFDFRFDRANRAASIDFQVDTAFGEVGNDLFEIEVM